MKKIILLTASLHSHIGLEWQKRINRINNEHTFDNISDLFKCMNSHYKNFPNYSEESIAEAERYADRVIKLAEKNSISIITGRSDYPVLYAKGVLSKINDTHRCGIVGTRHPSGKIFETVKIEATKLSKNGICIVSGLAAGCDTAAHLGALSSNGGTVAVLPCGILAIYPYENKDLAAQITENGLLISLFPPDAPIQSYRAILRNYLIADLSDPLILAESTLDGGSKYAINYSIENGKKVFAFSSGSDSFSLNQGILQNGTGELYSHENILHYYKIAL